MLWRWTVPKRNEVITVRDEEGFTHEFTLVDVFDVGGQRYAILQPADDDTAVVFRIEDDALIVVDDDAELERVAAAIRSFDEYDEVKLLGVTSADRRDSELGPPG